MSRLIAALTLFIPGIIGAYGIKLMRDAIFSVVAPFLFNEILQFFIGLIFFVIGIGFIGGFILHRDRKKQLVKESIRSKSTLKGNDD